MSDKELSTLAILQHENTRLECYIEYGKCKVGDAISLKNHEQHPEWFWDVVSLSEPILRTMIKESHNAEKWHKNDYRFKVESRSVFK